MPHVYISNKSCFGNWFNEELGLPDLYSGANGLLSTCISHTLKILVFSSETAQLEGISNFILELSLRRAHKGALLHVRRSSGWDHRNIRQEGRLVTAHQERLVCLLEFLGLPQSFPDWR